MEFEETDNTTVPAMKMGWRFDAEMTALGMACAMPLLVLAVPFLILSAARSVTVVGVLAIGGRAHVERRRYSSTERHLKTLDVRLSEFGVVLLCGSQIGFSRMRQFCREWLQLARTAAVL